MSALHIRPATRDDAEPIARLLTQLGYPVSASEVPARLVRLANAERGAVEATLETVEVDGPGRWKLHRDIWTTSQPPAA